MSVLKVVRRDVRATSPLLKWASNNTSQGGEDGIINRLLTLLDPVVTEKFCVDVGSWNGKHLSNTFSLLHNPESPWHGLLIEANPQRSEEASLLYHPYNSRVTCLSSLVTPEQFPHLLSQHGVPQNLAFLTIDIDGNDYWLLHSLLHTEYRPVILCIEFNPTIPNCVIFIQDPTGGFKGSSLRALRDLAADMGYSLVATTTFNAIFVLTAHYHLLTDLPQRTLSASLSPCVPLDLDDLHSQDMCTWMFQCYDGELKYGGVKKLLWQDKASPCAIDGTQLQVLKKKDWKFAYRPPES